MNRILLSKVILLSVILRIAGAQSPSPNLSWTKDLAGVSVSLPKGTLRFLVCRDRIIRVQFVSQGHLKPLPDIIQPKNWEPIPFNVSEDSSGLMISTKSLKVSLSNGGEVISFANASGMVFLTETVSGARVVRNKGEGTPPWRIQQSFAAAPDEFLYGMGQYQEGVWNWRGMPLELIQQNTQVVVPMLLSSKGYGVLWNNASWSFLNPCDEQVPLTGPSTNDFSSPKATEEVQGAVAVASASAGGTATPKPKPTPPPLVDHIGIFTPKVSGPHVFHVLGGDRSQELSLRLDGQTLRGITNMWTPYAISGIADLKAGTPVNLTVRSKSGKVTLWTRPRGDLTVFRSTQGDLIDYTVFYGPDLETVIAGYREATGSAPLLPRWAFGFWQCRERYSSSQELLDAVDGYRSRHIPMDLIVQDWQYWGKYGWGAYQWDEKNYPDPKGLIQGLHDRHTKFMISVWPNPHGKAGDAIKAANGLINGGIYDATNPGIRSLRWKFLNDGFFSIGTDAWWQDAAEPGDDGIAMEGAITFLGSGSLWRNAYPLFHSQCIYEGQRATDPGKRVCNLTRSAFLGQQRYGTVTWSGDVGSDWTTLRRQISAGLNFCMAGIPYWTTDCGGFFRRGTQSPDANEIQIRWFEWSTFCPVLRIHGYKTHTEFWNWLPGTQKILADYDSLRYRMLPYNYSVAWQVTSAGSTMMRALAFDFRNDAKALAIDDEYLFGPSILVAPVTSPKADHRDVYLPKCDRGTDWIDFWNGDRVPGGSSVKAAAPIDRIPLYVKTGSILPLGPDLEWTSQKSADPIELRIFPGADGTFILYEDEGDSYRYESGTYATIPISWSEKDQTLTIADRIGSFPGMLKKRTFQIVWVGTGHGTGGEPANPDQKITYEGKSVVVKRP